MAGPWEEYQRAPASSEQPPWMEYRQPRKVRSFDVAADGSLVPSDQVRYGPETEGDQWFRAAENVLRGGAQLATGMGASIAGDVAGLGTIVADFATGRHFDLDPAAVKEKVVGALTYQPENREGLITRGLQAVGDAVHSAGNYLGEKAEEATGGNIYAGHVARAIPQAALEAIGIKGSQVVRGIPVRPGTMGNLTGETVYKQLPAAAPAVASAPARAPSTDELKAASREAYDRARAVGAEIREGSFAQAKNRIAAMLQEEGIDPTLHPSTTAVLRRLEQESGPIPLDKIETLRRIAKDAQGSLEPADRRLAAKVVEELDDYADSIDPRHLSRGTPEAVEAFKEARGLWARARKADTIADMIQRAETRAGAHYTQAGMEHALRQFNAEEQAAIKKIARGGAIENTLRGLGKFDPTTSVVSAAGSLGTGALLSGATSGVSALLPIAGMVARRVATRMTRGKVEALDEMVRRGPATTRRRSASPGGTPDRATNPGETNTARRAAEIQSQIQALAARARFELAREPANSPKVREFAQEWARLRNELLAIGGDQ
jgi:hypothetical protein